MIKKGAVEFMKGGVIELVEESGLHLTTYKTCALCGAKNVLVHEVVHVSDCALDLPNFLHCVRFLIPKLWLQ